MSDTTKLVLGIVLAVAVIALIIWLFTSGRRREKEARRMEAQEVRSRLEERLPVVQEHEDRASVTERIAADARREAEARAAEAARLEREAAEHRSAAEQLRAEQDELARRADRIDPDVRTDDEGFRLDDSGRRLSRGNVASAFGAAALSQESEEEPDLADHENPFAEYAAEPAARDRMSSGGADEGVDEADWVNGPVDEDAADEAEVLVATDSQAADWINDDDDGAPFDRVEDRPVAGEPAVRLSEDHEGLAGQPPAVEHRGPEGAVLADEAPARPVTSPAPAAEPEPALEERLEAVETTTAREAPSASEAAPTAQGTAHGETPAADQTREEAVAREGETQTPQARRVSALDEVADGGYGVGSAAPIGDGAQPLGHPVMGFRDSMTFSREGDGAHDASPDVWFYDEDAARRSGYRATDER